jgi:hypothetical protein
MTSNGTSKDTSNGADASSGDLYHVKCEIIDYYSDPSGLTRTTDIYGTYTTLPHAKTAARTCLEKTGYDPSEFEIYEVKTDPEAWKYGDDVLVYTKAPSGVEFRVRVDVTPNNLAGQLKTNVQGEVESQLYYVLQTQIDYYTDRTGGIQRTDIEGVYISLEEAEKAAYEVLLDESEGVTKETYAEYERADEFGEGDWPYGEDELVHAVGTGGENFKVEVKVRAKGFNK